MEPNTLSPWKGAIVGGLVAFAWSAISWMALPFHSQSIRSFTDAGPVVAAVQAQAPQSGLYLVSNDPTGQTAPTDPFIFLSYHKPGWGPMGPAMLAGLAVQCLGALLWTLILGRLQPQGPKDAALCGLIFGLGLGTLGFLPHTVWWKWPLPFSMLYVVDAAAAWSAASVAIAALARRR